MQGNIQQEKIMKAICTHSGGHHADDAIGCAVLHALHPTATIVRSRDPSVWATCDALVDVGGEYDAVTNRFDHHQKGFSERRENGISYAGAGLVWSSYGAAYVQNSHPEMPLSQAQRIADDIDARLIQFVDAVDTGIDVPGPDDYGLSGILDTLNPTWVDDGSQADARFTEAMELAGVVLRNLVRKVAAEHAAEAVIACSYSHADGRILVLDKPRVPYDKLVSEKMPGVLFVVYPDSNDGHQVRVVPKTFGKFEARADLPAEWAGLRDDALAKVAGVPDAVFCHNARFICGARSRLGALTLAEKALAAVLA
ncbi:MYG1 family protein [Paraburkholderia sp. A3RO-2L]|jgi:uncharacterized UPF0160 family protein|uniref:MYG1 family protein n=1 Tax=Paraburkholderia sp. A3RO-2L TaxID=3028376 RepID=UPI003DA7FC4B